MITKQIILEEIEQDIDNKSEDILKLKENYNSLTDLDKVLDLYKEIKKLEYMKEYIESLHDVTDEQEEKNLAINELNYA